MKHYPRPPYIRKTVKWTSAAMVVVFGIAWACSLRWWVYLPTDGRWMVGMRTHKVFVAYLADETQSAVIANEIPSRFRMDFAWIVRPNLWTFWANDNQNRSVSMPFWVPMLLFGGVSGTLHRRDRRPSHALRKSQCVKCGYDRTGLKDAGAACPECGTAPADAKT